MSTDPLVRRLLDRRYMIDNLLASEELGNVYRAHDCEEDRDVLVKALHPELSSDSKAFARFAREISASWMVSHPNTVEVLNWGQEDDISYMVFEDLRFFTLAQALRGGPMEADRVIDIAAQIASALAAAHQEGIWHRALSSETVVIVDQPGEDVVKVRDFGLAKLEGSDPTQGPLTGHAELLGHVLYMAPEHIEQGTFDQKSDMYSVGCLMYEMISGKPPFDGDHSTVLMAHVTDEPSVVTSPKYEIPQWLTELIMELLSKNPEDRPTANKLVSKLETGAKRAVGLNKGKEVVAPDSSEGIPKMALYIALFFLIGGVGFAILVALAASIALVWVMATA